MIQDKKGNLRKINKLSKQIREHIRNDQRSKRLRTLEHYIEKSGGTRKALKVLREKNYWIPKLKKAEKSFTQRKDILETTTDFYKTLYSDQSKQINYETNANNKNKVINPSEYSTQDKELDILQCEVEKAIRSQYLQQNS
ncbi:unnamed protein product [Pieris macdunnoughi]|uniref:Uncharacterized protein n=1 Tax=Pieris macdunnoughi TaxID=345717 RepID=A0A821XSB3_9NEOP|nr:unnamed protein product [Pieris macdunnoughi]